MSLNQQGNSFIYGENGFEIGPTGTVVLPNSSSLSWQGPSTPAMDKSYSLILEGRYRGTLITLQGQQELNDLTTLEQNKNIDGVLLYINKLSGESLIYKYESTKYKLKVMSYLEFIEMFEKDKKQTEAPLVDEEDEGGEFDDDCLLECKPGDHKCGKANK